MAGVTNLGDAGIRDEVIKKGCSLAMKAHNSPEKQYLREKVASDVVIFSFPGSWSVSDWYASNSSCPSGTVTVDLRLFPSMKRIGLNESAAVNEAFQGKFLYIMSNSELDKDLRKAMTEGKQVILTGHSLGGPIAILTTIWLLEHFIRHDPSKVAPRCLTFGSPLVGDHIVNHALRRENWSGYFMHFVTRYDIVPRISLSPCSTIVPQLPRVLDIYNPKTPSQELGKEEAQGLYVSVLRNMSFAASYAACKMKGNTNMLLENLLNFVELSPYVPFGNYVFCTGNQKLMIVRNTKAALQLLSYSCKLPHSSQLNFADHCAEIFQRSIRDHLSYKNEVNEKLEMLSLDDHLLESLHLSSGGGSDDEPINAALKDLGLGLDNSTARLCLRAAAEVEKQKLRNMETIDKKRADIEKALTKLEGYKIACKIRNTGYYDAFKISEHAEDFRANVARLELAGIWDEIVEMLKRCELPDEFENKKEWIDLGTRYRRLVEPLDIANYYRHLKNEDTGPYMDKGRPKRYKCAQRWRKHSLRLQDECLESCFLAEVEELSNKTRTSEVQTHFSQLHTKVIRWIQSGDVDQDVLEYATYKKLSHF